MALIDNFTKTGFQIQQAPGFVIPNLALKPPPSAEERLSRAGISTHAGHVPFATDIQRKTYTSMKSKLQDEFKNLRTQFGTTSATLESPEGKQWRQRYEDNELAIVTLEQTGRVLEERMKIFNQSSFGSNYILNNEGLPTWNKETGDYMTYKDEFRDIIQNKGIVADERGGMKYSVPELSEFYTEDYTDKVSKTIGDAARAISQHSKTLLMKDGKQIDPNTLTKEEHLAYITEASSTNVENLRAAVASLTGVKSQDVGVSGRDFSVGANFDWNKSSLSPGEKKSLVNEAIKNLRLNGYEGEVTKEDLAAEANRIISSTASRSLVNNSEYSERYAQFGSTIQAQKEADARLKSVEQRPLTNAMAQFDPNYGWTMDPAHTVINMTPDYVLREDGSMTQARRFDVVQTDEEGNEIRVPATGYKWQIYPAETILDDYRAREGAYGANMVHQASELASYAVVSNTGTTLDLANTKAIYLRPTGYGTNRMVRYPGQQFFKPDKNDNVVAPVSMHAEAMLLVSDDDMANVMVPRAKKGGGLMTGKKKEAIIQTIVDAGGDYDLAWDRLLEAKPVGKEPGPLKMMVESVKESVGSLKSKERNAEELDREYIIDYGTLGEMGIYDASRLQQWFIEQQDDYAGKKDFEYEMVRFSDLPRRQKKEIATPANESTEEGLAYISGKNNKLRNMWSLKVELPSQRSWAIDMKEGSQTNAMIASAPAGNQFDRMRSEQDKK